MDFNKWQLGLAMSQPPRSFAQGEPITIYGDGRQVRDVLDVGDTVNAYVAALENIDRVHGRAFNLGGGPANALSLRELLRHLKDMTGCTPVVSYHPWRPGDQRWYVSDTSEIARALGWRAGIDVRSGLTKLLGWVQEAFAGTAARSGGRSCARRRDRISGMDSARPSCAGSWTRNGHAPPRMCCGAAPSSASS